MPSIPDRQRATRGAELRAEADHAAERLALYRRKVYVGRGDPRRLVALERIARAAAERLRRRLA